MSLHGQVRLSEVLYNEPSARTRLEWIEIYNPEDITIPLSNYRLFVDSDTVNFSDGLRIGPGSYAVLSRQLLADNGSDSFEGHWGDSSGYWGDYALEDYQALDCDFSLPNSAGAIILIDINGAYADSFEWDSEGLDGVSFERDNFDWESHVWRQSSSGDGSTPGQVNSTPIPNLGLTVDVEPRIISISRGETLKINVAAPEEYSPTIEIFNDTAILKRTFPEIVSGGEISVIWDGKGDSGEFLTPGIYIILCSLDFIHPFTKSIAVVVSP
jgi:LEA14-like dessication related protein